jgi:hypothetical protein
MQPPTSTSRQLLLSRCPRYTTCLPLSLPPRCAHRDSLSDFRRRIGARRTAEQSIGGYPHRMGARATLTYELFCTFLMCIAFRMALNMRFDVCEYASDLFSRHIKQGVLEDWMVTCFVPCSPQPSARTR